jgi:hypothetical protein
MIACILAVLLPKLQNIPGYEVTVKQFVDFGKRAEGLTGWFSGLRRCPVQLGRERGSPSRQATHQIAVAGTVVFSRHFDR